MDASADNAHKIDWRKGSISTYVHLRMADWKVLIKAGGQMSAVMVRIFLYLIGKMYIKA